MFPDQPGAPPLVAPTSRSARTPSIPGLAAQLVACPTAVSLATKYMLDEGVPSPYAASYDDPEVRESYPRRPDP